MASNDAGSSKKRDADIQTQIVCGVEKEAPESPTKDIETQTQFTYDPKKTNSEIIPEIQTQDPVHSEDNVVVVEPEPEAELEAEDEAQEEELGESNSTPHEVQEYADGRDDEGNNDFMTEEVDASEMEAETKEPSLPDEEFLEAVSTWEEDPPDGAPTEEEPAPIEEEPVPMEEEVAAVEEENTVEINVQTDLVLGTSTVGIMQQPAQRQSDGIQTVFTYDVDHSVTKIERELQRTHPRHSSLKNKSNADDTVRDGEKAVDEESTPDEDMDDQDDDGLLANNQRIGKTQTDLILGVDSFSGLAGKCYSAGIQTVFTYDTDHSNTEVRQELRKTHPRHSIEEATPDETEVEEEPPTLTSKSMDIQTVFTYDVNNSDSNSRIERELQRNHPRHSIAADDANVGNDETDEDVEVVPDTSTEEEGISDVPAATDENYQEDLEVKDENSTEIEVQTSMMFGVDSKVNIPLNRQSAGIQTVFTYDGNLMISDVKEELRKTHPRHSTDNETDAEAAPAERDVVAETTPIEDGETSPGSEENTDVLTTNDEKTEGIEVQTLMMLGAGSTAELRSGVQSTDVQTDLTYNSVPRKSMDVQTMFTYDINNSDTQIQVELKRTHPRHSTDKHEASEVGAEVEGPPSVDEEVDEPVSTWEEDPPDEPAETEEAVVEADPPEEEVTPVGEDETGLEDDEARDLDTSIEEKTAEIDVQTSMMLGVDSTGVLPPKFRSTGVQTDLTYNSVPRKSMDVQTMFTYDINNSDTQIQVELKRTHPRHSTDEQQIDESNAPDVETDDEAPEGSVSSEEGELETRFIDATHSKAEDWLPETADIDVDVLGDEEELIVTEDEPVQESRSDIENGASQSRIRDSSDDELIIPENENVPQTPVKSVAGDPTVAVHKPVSETVDNDTTDLPKTIKLKIQIVVGDDREPMNMDIAIAVRPLSRDDYLRGALVTSEDTLLGIPKGYLKQVVSTIIDAVLKELPDGTELRDKREVEAQTNMALGRDSMDEQVKNVDLIDTPPTVESELGEEEAIFIPSTDQFEMVPMLETDLLVPREKIPPQYISSLVPLSDDNCESVEDLPGKWRRNRRFSDKLLLDSSARRVSSALDPKKSPKLLATQDVDYEHWGFPYALNTRYESVVSFNDNLQLDEDDDASSIEDESVRSTFIFQMKKLSEETLFYDNTKSIVKDKMSIQMETNKGGVSNGQKNRIKVILQYGGDIKQTDVERENNKNTAIDEKEDDDSVFVATVELEESESGEITSFVHYSAGNTSQSKPIIFGESPFELNIPINRERMLEQVSETEENESKPEQLRLISIVVIHDGDDSNRESIALLDNGAPVTISIPVGDGTIGFTVTANIVRGGLPIDDKGPAVEIIPPKPIRCTVITNGVPGETFEQIMEERSDTAEPIFFFLPMAEGMVRARLLIVPCTEPLNPPSARASHLPKGTAVSCQVVHGGIPGTQLTKILQPGGLPLHMDIPQNLGLSAKILIPHDGDRLSDGDYCRDRAFEMVADALSTYEQGIQPMQNLLDEICEKVKRLPVPEMAGLGEPADQPYVDLFESDVFSESDSSVLEQRGNSPRSSNTRCQRQQHGHCPRHSQDFTFSQCHCGNTVSRRFVPAQSSPQYRNCNELTETYPISPRSNHSPLRYQRSCHDHHQRNACGIGPQGGTRSPVCLCAEQRSGSKGCGQCGPPTSPLAQMYIKLSQPWISPIEVSESTVPSNDLNASRGSSYEQSGSRVPSDVENDSSGPSYDQCGVRVPPHERRMYSGGCADLLDLSTMSGQRRENQPGCGAGSPMRRSLNMAPSSRGGIRGRCQRCGSSAVEMSLPTPPPPSCGCDAIVPFETALMRLPPPVVDDSTYSKEPTSRGCRC